MRYLRYFSTSSLYKHKQLYNQQNIKVVFSANQDSY